jgi:hypothetical protein
MPPPIGRVPMASSWKLYCPPTESVASFPNIPMFFGALSGMAPSTFLRRTADCAPSAWIVSAWLLRTSRLRVPVRLKPYWYFCGYRPLRSAQLGSTEGYASF